MPWRDDAEKPRRDILVRRMYINSRRPGSGEIRSKVMGKS